MKLRTRLALALALILVALAGAGWAILHIVPASQQAEVDRKLRNASLPAGSYAPPPGGNSSTGTPPGGARPQGATAPAGATGSGDSAVAPPQPFSDAYIVRIAADDTRVAVFPNTATTAVPEMPAGGVDADGRPRISTVGSVGGGPRWRAVLMTSPGGSRFLVAVSLAQADATTSQVRLAVFGVGAAILLVLGLAGWWVLRLGLRPIAEVTTVADAITAGDRSRRVALQDPHTEAGHLGRAFNVMLDEHQGAEDKLRRFVADASHELRTPVAAIRGFADLYRAGALDDPAVLNDAMRRIGGESARMAGLVEDLLLLARLDEGRPLDARPVDLATVLQDAAFDASATHPTRTVDADVAEPLTVVGDEARLRQVVTNLVQNALTHGGPDANVRVRGRRQEALCIVEVTDDGVGMPTEDTPLVFDRFWRADKARVRNANGAGLGLSIVRAITEAHGGRVTMESAPGAGTTVRVVLPAA